MEKVHIEPNTVQETLAIPLYGRKMCTQRFSRLFQDPKAVELIGRLDYDFTALEKRAGSLGYNDLRDPSVPGLFRAMARLGDGYMKMQIVRIDFDQ